MIIFLIIFVSLVFLIFLISLWAYFRTFFNQKKKAKLHKLLPGKAYGKHLDRINLLISDMESNKKEEIIIRSYDGKKLVGYYYHIKDGAPVHIQFHGYKGNCLRDFCGGNKLARDLGHNTLVVHQRAHGASGGRTITFGIKERIDCLYWARYVAKRFGDDVPIFLSGVSMGATTVLMASELDLPQNVVGIIADCPYDSPQNIIKKIASELGYPATLVFPFVRIAAFLFGHFDILSSDVYKALQKSEIPTLIIHGEDDSFVPCEMSRKIYASDSKKIVKLCTIPHAEHGLSYMVDTETYTKEAGDFINSILKKESTED